MSVQESPVAVLKAEHQLILRLIRVLGGLMDEFESKGQFIESSLERCVEFLRLFADACHHGKEESLLFPILEMRGIPREGGPIGVMLYEHAVGRQLTQEMHSALKRVQSGDAAAKMVFCQAARRYNDLLTNHIFKEDNVLFNMGDRIMSPDDKNNLTTQFCAVNCKVFEEKRREQLQSIVDELEARHPR